MIKNEIFDEEKHWFTIFMTKSLTNCFEEFFLFMCDFYSTAPMKKVFWTKIECYTVVTLQIEDLRVYKYFFF